MAKNCLLVHLTDAQKVSEHQVRLAGDTLTTLIIGSMEASRIKFLIEAHQTCTSIEHFIQNVESFYYLTIYNFGIPFT